MDNSGGAWQHQPIAGEVNVVAAPKSVPVIPLVALTLICGMLFAAPDAAAVDVIAAQALARQSGCLQCHSVYQKKIGPAWKDVASKYHADSDAKPRLYKHVTTGRKAKFDDGHEEAHPIVKTSDTARINNLVDWISVGTVTNVFGTTQFTDGDATNLPYRFYRAIGLGL